MADTQLAQGSNGDVAGNPPADGAAQVNMTTQLQQSFYVALIKVVKLAISSDFLNKLPSPFCYPITTKTRCVDAHDVIMCLSNYVYFVKSICTLKCLLLFFTYVSNSHWIDKYLATTWLKPLSLL